MATNAPSPLPEKLSRRQRKDSAIPSSIVGGNRTGQADSRPRDMSRRRKLLRHPAWLTYFGNDRTGETTVMNHVLYGHGPIRAILLHGWFGDAHCFRPKLLPRPA